VNIKIMNPELAQLLPQQAHPALSILRMAALSADSDGALDDETLNIMSGQACTLADVNPTRVWAELAPGLMARKPSNMFRALHHCGMLEAVLPEVAALFGVHQIANDPPQVDIGCHLLRVLDEAARCDAPMPVRFAAMVMNIGKSDSPPEHLPVHYRHIERGSVRIDSLCDRFDISRDCRDMAIVALAECERVHRVSEVRAGPVADMLARLGAFSNLADFQQLMLLCSCDYRAYPGCEGHVYPKAALLEMALKACADINDAGLAADALRDARAIAIAATYRSERWSDSVS
jgi:tRNA nucleotidyltransferase (CCA-adding enzyme)